MAEHREAGSAAGHTTVRRRVLTLLRLAIGVAIIVYLFVSDAIEWSALGGLFEGWPLALLAMAIFTVVVFLLAWRLVVLLSTHRFRLSILGSLRLTLIGVFFNSCLPGSGGGDLVKIYYATVGNEGRKTEVVTVMLLDRIAGLLALVLFPVLVAPLFWPLLREHAAIAGLVGVAAAASVALIGGLALAQTGGAVGDWLRRTLARLPGGSYLTRILATLRGYREDRAALAKAVGISLVAHALTMVAMVILAALTGDGRLAWQLMLLIPLGFVVNAVPLTPGGLGVGEAAFDALFGLAAFDGGAETLLAWRLAMILFGLVGLSFYLRGVGRVVWQQPESGDRSAGSDSELEAPAS